MADNLLVVTIIDVKTNDIVDTVGSRGLSQSEANRVEDILNKDLDKSKYRVAVVPK